MATAPVCEFEEARIWREFGGGWRCLSGCFCQSGLSVEWHDFSESRPRPWSRSFHPVCLEICLNLSGRAQFSGAEGTTLLGACGACFYWTGIRDSLTAWRLPGERHQFLTIELGLGFLRERLTGEEAGLHPLVRAVLAGRDEPGFSGLTPLSPVLRREAEALPAFEGEGPARFLFHQGKALEWMARLFFDPGRSEEFVASRRCDLVARKRVEQVMTLIAASLAEPPSLKELGRRVGCSPYHLSRTFSREMGRTIPQYTRELRMERAAEMLRSGRHNVTEAALEVGYSSLSHFSHAFRETMGCCPGLYPLGLPAIHPGLAGTLSPASTQFGDKKAQRDGSAVQSVSSSSPHGSQHMDRDERGGRPDGGSRGGACR